MAERAARTTAWTPALWLVAALPGVVAVAIVALQLSRGWSPLSDDAVIATRAWDVLSSAAPLLGQATLASGAKGQSAYDLGPVYYFLLTLPEHASAAAGPLLGASAIWLAAAYSLVAAARAAYGPTGLLAAALVLLVFEWQAPAVVTDPLWNPHAAVMWFLAALASLLAVIEGRHRWYPFATFAASLAIQTNVVVLVPVLVVWAVGTLSLLSVAERRSERRSERRRAPVPRTFAAGMLVGVLCWVPTVVQQASGRPGNLSSWIWYLSHHASTGMEFALESVAVLGDPRVMLAALRRHSVVVTATFIARESPLAGMAVLGLLACVAVWSRHRNRPERHVVSVVLLVALSLGYTFGNMPPEALTSVDYLSVVLLALACVLWVLLVVAAISAIPELVVRRRGAYLRALPYVAIAAMAAMLLPRAVSVAGTGNSPGSVSMVNEASADIERRVPRGPVVVAMAVDGPQSTDGYAEYADVAGVVWKLRVAGWRPEVYGALWDVFGPTYSAHRGAYVAIAHATSDAGGVQRLTVERPRS